jgi:phosphoglycolate phosphatase
MINTYDTVVFDMDGTVMNTLEDLLDSINYTLDFYNYPNVKLSEIGGYMGNGLEKMFEKCFPNNYVNPLFQEAFIKFKAYYMEHCQIKTKPYKGILELMETLQKKNYKMAIVSNKAHEAVLELNNLFFSNYVTIAIGEKDGIRKKPFPDGVLKALELLNSKKETSVYVGDTEVDRKTAQNSNLDCVLVSWGFRDRAYQETLQANCIIDNPLQLLDFLK